MLLGDAQDQTLQSRDFLLYNADLAIRNVLDKNNIATIDKNIRSRLINLVLNNRNCISGNYTLQFIENLIECELFPYNQQNTRR
jgi:hypothetical protein